MDQFKPAKLPIKCQTF